MNKESILIKRDVVKKSGGLVVLDLAKYKKIESRLEQYVRKEETLKSINKFEKLTQWGRDFAKKNKITSHEVLEDD